MYEKSGQDLASLIKTFYSLQEGFFNLSIQRDAVIAATGGYMSVKNISARNNGKKKLVLLAGKVSRPLI